MTIAEVTAALLGDLQHSVIMANSAVETPTREGLVLFQPAKSYRRDELEAGALRRLSRGPLL